MANAIEIMSGSSPNMRLTANIKRNTKLVTELHAK